MVLADLTFDDLDSSARLQARPCGAAEAETGSGAASRAAAAIVHLGPWDTVHFVHVAKCGYETDMSNAFFPGLPLAMRTLTSLPGVRALRRVLPAEAAFTLAGLAISLIAFCAAAAALHRLSLGLLRDRRLADLSLLLFCFNPASVFYSAAYSESLFAGLTFWGMLLLSNSYWASVVLLAAASAARSNGILSCWFLIHQLLLLDWKQEGRLRWAAALRTAGGCIAIVAPYAAHQAQAYLAFCRRSTEPAPEWCHAVPPSIYGYIQTRYWDVGFLRFYRDPRRWPMIITALPVAFLSIRGCCAYFSADWTRALTLGLFSYGETLPSPLRWLAGRGCALLRCAAPGVAAQQQQGWRRRSSRLAAAAAAASPVGKQGAGATGRHAADAATAAVRAAPEPGSHGFLGPATAPYVYHWALMTAVALLVMNVNVATRFLSACPALYWFTAHYLLAGSRRAMHCVGPTSGWRCAWVWGWCLAYIALGCLLFPNFYPWV
eukprot:scaffold14.g1126.t1